MSLRTVTTAWALALAAAACTKSDADTPAPKPVADQAWEAKGYREPDPAARAEAVRVLAAADLGLSSDWMADLSRDGKRQFARDGVVLELFVAEAQDQVAVADEPARSLEDLLRRTAPEATSDGWPFWSYRFGKLTARSSAAGELWVRGRLQSNDQCGDRGCADVWEDRGEAGFVMFRVLDRQRVRCAAHGLALGGGNAVLEAAFTACRSMTVKAN